MEVGMNSPKMKPDETVEINRLITGALLAFIDGHLLTCSLVLKQTTRRIDEIIDKDLKEQES